MQLLVLNDARQLAGIGEVGEIYVRTPYLTKGYIDDEALTQERFITIRLRTDPAIGCIRRGIWPATGPMATSNSSAGATIR